MNKKLIKAAKDFLLVYFSDGKKHTPSNFDRDILGGIDTFFLTGGRPRWNETPFFDALTELIDEEIILWNQGKEGKVTYWLNAKR